MSQKIYISSAYWMRNMETIQIGLMLELQRTNVHLPTLQNQLFFTTKGFPNGIGPTPTAFQLFPSVTIYLWGVHCIGAVYPSHQIDNCKPLDLNAACGLFTMNAFTGVSKAFKAMTGTGAII